jgi:hypothetical protein
MHNQKNFLDPLKYLKNKTTEVIDIHDERSDLVFVEYTFDGTPCALLSFPRVIRSLLYQLGQVLRKLSVVKQVSQLLAYPRSLIRPSAAEYEGSVRHSKDYPSSEVCRINHEREK